MSSFEEFFEHLSSSNANLLSRHQPGKILTAIAF